MGLLQTPKTNVKQRKTLILGSRGLTGGPGGLWPYCPTIRSSLFSAVGVGGKAQPISYTFEKVMLQAGSEVNMNA